MRRNMSGNLGLYKYLWPGSVYDLLVDEKAQNHILSYESRDPWFPES